MRKKVFVLLAATLIVLLTMVSYSAVKKYNAKKKLTNLYQQGLKPIYDKENPFSLDARLVYLDSLLRTHAPGYSSLDAQLLKANILLKLGREKEALDLLNALLTRLNPEYNGPELIRVKSLLALTYIRMGERNNCIGNHSAESCIMPIRNKGVYIDPTATKKAIDLYEDLLKLDSGDLDSRWLLNIAYMTIGGYPDLVPTQWIIPGLDTVGTSKRSFPSKI
jgi:tetratricopeptide (TPR) repeat protein